MADLAIIGGGIVGLATAWQIKQRFPRKHVVLVEKEARVGLHQTGHNSGVIHAGVYYEPGSLKATLCRRGLAATYAFCRDHGVPVEQRGKLIVASSQAERERLNALYARALSNELDVSLLERSVLRDLEPEVNGVAAMRVPATGITVYADMARALAAEFERIGGELRLNTRVVGLAEGPNGIRISAHGSDIDAAYVIACAGLQSDRVASMLGLDIDFRIVPYRGEYYRLPDSLNALVKHLVYPVPDPALPFLGVHLTPTIDGPITVGPNAVQAWKREGHGKLDFSPVDTWDMLSFAGFWRVTRKYFGHGVRELRDSLWKRGYLEQVRKICPTVQLDDLEPWPAGIRAQAVLRDGSLVHDFLFADSPRSLHVCNAPSPAATSALPIGAYLCDEFARRIG